MVDTVVQLVFCVTGRGLDSRWEQYLYYQQIFVPYVVMYLSFRVNKKVLMNSKLGIVQL